AEAEAQQAAPEGSDEAMMAQANAIIAAGGSIDSLVEAATAAAPLMELAESRVLAHARKIRATLRECEKIAAEEMPAFESQNGPQTLDDLLAALAVREKAYAARTNQVGRMKALIAVMDGSLRDLKRGVAKVVQEGQRFVRERERRMVEEAAAEAKRQEEERKRAEAAEAAERGEAEAARVREVAESRQELIDKFDYDTFAVRMKRMESELATPEGRDELRWCIERAERAGALRKWLLEDIAKNGEVVRGFRGKVLTGVTPDRKKLKVNLMPDFDVDKMTVADWVVLARALLENRRPERGGLTPSEHGEMLFNTAIFAYLHGAADPGAMALARNLAAKAVELRTSLQSDAAKLLPILEDGGDDAEESAAPSEGAAALDF
ncbi:MAG: hypothetical protein IJS46_00645, partial [Kiritimatiellae bacterium]|nr:hypothetical protein [Kiritimatiellia bacterium]